MKGIGVRFEIKDSGGMPVGVSIIPNIFDSLEETDIFITIKYDFSSLAPGNYQTIYVFFQNDQYGNGSDLDCVSGMDIYIREPEETELNWRTMYWGNIMFDAPEIIDIGNIS
ncbi:hypothetical protein [uncultured Bacteroides sp.]|uniref:hypothetical protein n=1 Tax=uncultured Bacteroides sp. TaxID=162156 RepID=UPI002607DB35|nr:hypothetical protein [uncultured Bacteroides sp.]